MSIEALEARLQRLEEQNERILRLLEEVAASSFSYKGKKLPEERPDFPKSKRRYGQPCLNRRQQRYLLWTALLQKNGYAEVIILTAAGLNQ